MYVVIRSVVHDVAPPSREGLPADALETVVQEASISICRYDHGHREHWRAPRNGSPRSWQAGDPRTCFGDRSARAHVEPPSIQLHDEMGAEPPRDPAREPSALRPVTNAPPQQTARRQPAMPCRSLELAQVVPTPATGSAQVLASRSGNPRSYGGHREPESSSTSRLAISVPELVSCMCWA